MKKSFDVLSDVRCIEPHCDKKIKQRHVDNDTSKPRRCFDCYRNHEEGRDHPMVTAHEVRKGVRPGKQIKVIPPHVLERLKKERKKK